MSAVPTSILGASARRHRHRDERIEPERLVCPDDREAIGIGTTDAVDDDVE